MISSLRPATHISVSRKYQKIAHRPVQDHHQDGDGVAAAVHTFSNFHRFIAQRVSGGVPTYMEFHPTDSSRYLVTTSAAVQLFEEGDSPHQRGGGIRGHDEGGDDDDEGDADMGMDDAEQQHLLPSVVRCRTYTKFDLQPYSASFRPNDGSMMIVAGESGKLQLMRADMQAAFSKTAMRKVAAHRSPCHVVRFLHHESINQVFSAADDKSVKLWDVLQERNIATFAHAHGDYVRAGCSFSDNGSLFATGSYDHTVKVWDIRDHSKTCKMSFDHGAPIECVVKHPTSPLLYTCGGNYFKVWDLLRPDVDKPLRVVHSHQNTITTLSINRDATHIITSGLDRQLKVHDIEKNYAVVHSMTFPDAVLCSGISADENMLVVGMRTKLMKSKRQDDRLEAQKAAQDRLNSDNYRYLINTYLLEEINSIRNQIFSPKRRESNIGELKPLLAKFRYKDALDSALSKFMEKPVIVMSLIEELKSRNELLNALDARDEVTLLPILQFIIRYMRDQRFALSLLELAHLVVAIYGEVMGHSEIVDHHFRVLRARTNQEIHLQQELYALRGTIDSLIVASSVHRQQQKHVK